MLAKLEQFFGGDAGFCGNVGVLLWEAVIKRFHVANADHVADFVPEVVGIKAVACARFLPVVKLSAAAVKDKAIDVVF